MTVQIDRPRERTSPAPPSVPTIATLPLPFLAALAVAGGWPWEPQQSDLEVYRTAAENLIAGAPLYAAEPGSLPMLYPPFAAVLALPIAALGDFSHVAWPLLNAALAVAVFLRLGATGWQASLLATAMIMLGGPYGSVMSLGQVGIVLMAMCLLDLAPGPTVIGRFLPHRDRLLPRGTLTGLAIAIKLTPALFVIVLILTGRRRPALVATGTALVTVVLGAILRPADSLYYWRSAVTNSLPAEADALHRVTNQSVGAVMVRFVGDNEAARFPSLIACGLAAAVAVVAGVLLIRANQASLALLVVGLGMCLAAPIGWHHAFTWAAPLAFLLLRRGAPQGLAILAVVYWGWVTVEPFWAVFARGEAALTLSPSSQFVAALGPLLAVALCALMGRWGHLLSRQHRTAAPAT